MPLRQARQLLLAGREIRGGLQTNLKSGLGGLGLGLGDFAAAGAKTWMANASAKNTRPNQLCRMGSDQETNGAKMNCLGEFTLLAR